MTHWKLVPVEPENEMINAALCAVEDQQGKHLEDLLADAYIAMLNAAPQTDAKPAGKFAKFTDGIWREVTAGSAGVPLYEHPPAADVQPVAWSVFDKRTQKHWYTNESVNTAGYYAKEYSHREPDGSPSMLVVPLYTHPAADVQELVEPIALEKVYETIVQWDEGGGKRSRRELAKQIIDLYTNTPAADVAELMAQEREACAKVVEENANAFIESRMFHDLLQSNADEIRARGGK